MQHNSTVSTHNQHTSKISATLTRLFGLNQHQPKALSSLTLDGAYGQQEKATRNNEQYTTMPLSRLPAGQKGEVVSMNMSGRIRHRLAALGLLPGASVDIVQAQRGGSPMLLALGDSRLAIEHHIAQHVLVRPVKQQSENSLHMMPYNTAKTQEYCA